jgi:hypothetical protein
VLDDMEPVHDAPGVGRVLARSFPEARAHVARHRAHVLGEGVRLFV